MRRATGWIGLRLAVGTGLAALTAQGASAQANSDNGYRRPDRWIVVQSTDQATRVQTPRMLYLGRDGTVLIVQCAARDGRKTGGWAFTVQRDDWYFAPDFLQGWWSVDSEPPIGPNDWGGTGAMVLLNDDGLKARMLEPVQEGIVLRVAQGTRQWELELAARDLGLAVEQFAPACQAT